MPNKSLNRPIYLTLFLSITGVLFLLFVYFAINLYRNEQAVRLFPIGKHFTNALSIEASIDIAIFGDSHCSKWYPVPESNNQTISNLGIAGETTAQALIRLKTNPTPLSPDLFIIQIGWNDLKTITIFPTHKTLIEERCAENIKAILKEIINRNSHPVLLTIIEPRKTFNLDRLKWNNSVLQAIKRINKKLLSFQSDNVTVLDTNSILNPELDFTDHIHLKPSGYRKLNHALRPILLRSLQAQGDHPKSQFN